MSPYRNLFKRMHRGHMNKITSDAVGKALYDLDKPQQSALEIMFEAAAEAEKGNKKKEEWMESDQLKDIEGWEWYDEGRKE